MSDPNDHTSWTFPFPYGSKPTAPAWTPELEELIRKRAERLPVGRPRADLTAALAEIERRGVEMARLANALAVQELRAVAAEARVADLEQALLTDKGRAEPQPRRFCDCAFTRYCPVHGNVEG